MTKQQDQEKQEERMMKVSIEADGEFITTEVFIDSKIVATFKDGHLRGIIVTRSIM